jgi:hypothetical protein
MRGVLFMLVFIMVAVVCVAQSTNDVVGKRTEGALERQVPGYNVERLTSFNAFSSALTYTHTPGGIVRVGACSDEPTVFTWRPAGANLRDTLKAIVLADPRYTWEYREGLVNILPVGGEPALLKTRIAKLDVGNATSANWPLGLLLALPEVKKAMTDLKLRWGVKLYFGAESRQHGFSVLCKDVSLLEALNAIARSHGSAVWDYVETHCDGKDEVTISF